MVWAVLLVTAIFGTDLLAWSATVGEGSGNPSVRAFSGSLGSGSTVHNDKFCSEGYCVGPNYDTVHLPKQPLDVKVDFDILQVTQTDDMEFWVDLVVFFGIEWEDPGLYFDNASTNANATLAYQGESNDQLLSISLDMVDHIWVPDIYIYNLKSVSNPVLFTKFGGLFVKKDAAANGGAIKFYYAHELQVKFWCKMRFDRFPFDKQRCHFRVGSYTYVNGLMKFTTGYLKYHEEDFQQATLLDYFVDQPERLKQADYYWEGHGNYSLAGFEFVLTRHWTKYIIYNYFPSCLFVGISWISFVVPIEAIPGRMALLVTLLLVQINIFNSSIYTQPNTEVITALSAWMLCCIIFVFGSLLAYAGLLYAKYWKKPKDPERKRAKQTQSTNSVGHGIMTKSTNDYFGGMPAIPTKQRDLDIKLEKMNFRCLYLIVALFGVYNAVYWTAVAVE